MARSVPVAGAQLLTEREVGDILRVTPRTVRTMASAGRLTRVRLGRRSTRYQAAEVLALIASCAQNKEGAALANATPSKNSAGQGGPHGP
jgi:predicted transcriptional regulator of viral defense system